MDDYDYDEDFEQDIVSEESSKKTSAIIKIGNPKQHGSVVTRKKKSTWTTQGNSLNDRLLSSKERELKDILNKLTVTKRILHDIEKENKILKRLQVRQEKELTKITSQEGELPMILQKHKQEVKSLRQQIRRTQLNNSELQKKMNDLSEELWKANERKKKLEILTKRHDLLEREQLTIQIQDIYECLTNRDRKIQELERVIELSQKTHTQEVKSLLAKQKHLSKQLNEAKQDKNQFRWQLREKERQLEVTNIYAQRVPHQSFPSPLPQVDDQSTQTMMTHPPCDETIMIIKPRQKTTGSQTDSKWLTDILSPKAETVKQSTLESNSSSYIVSTPTHTRNIKDNPSPYKAITTIPVSQHNGSTKDTPNPYKAMVSTPNTGTQPVSTSYQVVDTKPIPSKSVQSPFVCLSAEEAKQDGYHGDSMTTQPSIETEEKPLMDLGQLPSHGSPSVKPNIQEILFGNRQRKTVEIDISSDQKEPMLLNENTESQGYVELGAQEKKDLLTKLFPSQVSSADDDDTDVSTNSNIIRNEEVISTGNTHRPMDTVNSTVYTQQTRIERKSRDTSTTVHKGPDKLGPDKLGPDIPKTTDTRKGISTQEKSSLLDKLFNTSTSHKNSSIPSTDTSQYQTNDNIQYSGSVSSLSQSERIRNMHSGLPSLASHDDPYGTRNRRSETLVSSKPPLGSEEKNVGTKFGRRTREVSTNNGFIFGENKQKPSNTSLGLKPFEGTSSNKHDKTQKSTIFGSLSDTRIQESKQDYPWETKVDTSKQTDVSSLRPKRVEGLGVTTSMFSTDDDVEELII